jgi:hypothetical protein
MSTEKILEELRARQRRLGTPAELPGDMKAAQDLAHLINNRLTVEELTRFLKDTAHPFAVNDTASPIESARQKR